MGSGNTWEVQQLQAANVQLTQHSGWWMQLQAAASLSKGSVTIQGEPESGWLFKISRWLLTQTTISDDGTQASRSTIPLSLDRKPENNNKQNTHKIIMTSLFQENTAYLQRVSSQSIQHWGYQAALTQPFQIPKSKQEEGSFANRCLEFTRISNQTTSRF